MAGGGGGSVGEVKKKHKHKQYEAAVRAGVLSAQIIIVVQPNAECQAC